MNRVLSFFNEFLKKNDGSLNIFGKTFKIVIVFMVIKILIRISHILIDKTIESRKNKAFTVDEKKIDTLIAVLKNIIKYLLYFIGIMILLDIFGINTSSILATAGLGGLAISFAAQSLIKDIITGFFILFEDQYSIGDYVQIGDYQGIVEELGLRVTKLRDFSGELHIIPNSNIGTVTNKTRGAMRALVTVRIPYEEDVDRVINVLEEVSQTLRKSNESILEGPNILGISDLGEYGIEITVIARTKPMDQWGVERDLRKEIKKAFERENIKIPYPRMDIVNERTRRDRN
ncbi:mechanosensitive ion channel family protein [Tepidimicrobium xylanilyticum]|uniref:Small conductance mechanosensitive channel n=1 Tax=Tepidimicrobium xylanilyticum TaxID=1123352 RepID=A0A1H3CGT1_9FIRM|nr:mechanosensitive ion channel family protein [Tepidimicrobium xylanilyticum]GMG98002.1 mechanosensitive ion channel protein [Tepidimicrobium xylanilyticum]SDX52794.1 small conductance mechanosensitive channel [Tepidimicrobium xylanilyticum]